LLECLLRDMAPLFLSKCTSILFRPVECANPIGVLRVTQCDGMKWW